tara:strand:+ start:268 stop:456 length:189 start_codon:yes stop_codon:yes gene_type:complete
MSEKTVSDADLQKLRASGKIEQNEVALLVGDVVVAENVLTKERRVIETAGLILESKRSLLRG